MKKRVFIIDDEPDMIKIASDLLEAEGYQVTYDNRPTSGLKKVRASNPDLLLLDIRMPEMDGFQVCREIKNDPKTKHIPIIMVSVKADESDVVIGLELGAEDYISKPFRKRELLARVKTVIRRKEGDDEVEMTELGPIKVNHRSYTAVLNNKPLPLTPKEFELLSFFLQRQGRVLTRPAISECVWGFEFTGSTRTIDVHVDQIRKKLGKYGVSIKSLKGVGYRFDLEEEK